MHTQQSVAENNHATSKATYPFHGLKSPAEYHRPIKVFIKKHNDPRRDRSGGKTKNKNQTLLSTDGQKTLAGGIAHNFNNLLMGMNGYIELMLLKPDSKHTDRLKKIKKHIFYGSSQIQVFLRHARGGAPDSTGRVSTGRVSKGAAYETSKEGKTPADVYGRVGSMTLAAAADVIVEDLTQILGNIRSTTNAILNDISHDHVHHEPLGKVEKLVCKGTEMTTQLQKCSRKAQLKTIPVRLEWLVKETMDTFGGIMEKVKVHQAFSEDLLEVMADPCQIEQILQNMYLNAADAMPCGGDFFLEASNAEIGPSQQDPGGCGDNRYILLKIKDTGTGMDKETAGQIFEPFFSTKGLKGRGLGLSSVYGIVRAHGGRIDVDSKPGQGTTFMIYLPANDHRRTSGRAVEEPGVCISV